MNDETLTSSPRCLYYLVSSTDSVISQSKTVTDRLDEIPGIQAEVTITDLISDSPYDSVLRSAKVGSRYGKPLLDLYLDEIRTRLERVDEAALADELEAQFSRNGADPYQAGLTADVLTIGIDVKSKLEQTIETPEQLSFNSDDLAAAAGFAAEQENIQSNECCGAVLVQVNEPLSELVDRHSTGGLSNVVQQLLLAGLDVYFVGSRGGSDELEIIRNQFRRIGSFSVEEETQVEFDTSEGTKSFVEQWYESLSFDVADGRVRESVIRPASVVAYDLPERKARRHFFRAIVDGLQIAYAEQKSDAEEFAQLWSDRITPHPEYDQYRSQRSDFPIVTLAREDGRQREFRFTYRGPNTKPHIDGVPVRSEEIEEAFIDLLERYLDASVVDDEQWNGLLDGIRTGIGEQLDLDAESLAENALLRRARIRTQISPALSPVQHSKQNIRSLEEEKNAEWYRDHWRTILSDYKITTTTGTNIIKKKQELTTELNPESTADTALYYKLQRDIENAWEYYCSNLKEQIRVSLPDELAVDIEQQEKDARTDIRVAVHPPDAGNVTTTVSIYLPFSDVRVDEERVTRATVPTVVARILEMFEGVLYSRADGDEIGAEELLLEIIRLYCNVAEVEKGDLVYFEEIVTFAQSLPDIAERFQEPNQDIEESMYQKLGSRQVMDSLREAHVRFHRKGSDDRRSVKVRGDQYIAMELRDGAP
ncbi:hypothetical protein [Natronorubrum tibetense]|uniref:Uncharacterized protein n=1 Tax=Natronorubrum tibetense GA33 TaxID=1114856 RepID=L9VS95_9EURY|nr:hypothetical protein [Natronorubrum tibetense]ELY39867.1 hypothetical protein C496_14356 [Natronorubrum tibetense GA33]